MTAKKLQSAIAGKSSNPVSAKNGPLLDRVVLRIWEDPAIASYLSDVKVDEDGDTVALEFFEMPAAVVKTLVQSIGGDAKAYAYSAPDSGAKINAIKFKLSTLADKN